MADHVYETRHSRVLYSDGEERSHEWRQCLRCGYPEGIINTYNEPCSEIPGLATDA